MPLFYKRNGCQSRGSFSCLFDISIWNYCRHDALALSSICGLGPPSSTHSTFTLFLIPIKADWLLIGVIVLAILIPISELDIVSLGYYLTGILIGYLYSTLVWQTGTSFHFFEKADDFFIELGRSIRSKIKPFSSKKKVKSSIFKRDKPL